MDKKPWEQDDSSSEVFEKSYQPTTDQLDDNDPPKEDSSPENSPSEEPSSDDS